MEKIRYGVGYKQRRIIELGKKNLLTFGDLIGLYGYSKATDEFARLIVLGLVDKPKTAVDGKTKLEWKKKID